MSTQETPDLTINEEPDGTITIRLLSEQAREVLLGYVVHSDTRTQTVAFGFSYRSPKLLVAGDW